MKRQTLAANSSVPSCSWLSMAIGITRRVVSSNQMLAALSTFFIFLQAYYGMNEHRWVAFEYTTTSLITIRHRYSAVVSMRQAKYGFAIAVAIFITLLLCAGYRGDVSH